MTFNEAKKRKEEIGETITIGDEEFSVLVVPSDEIGRTAYFTNQRMKKTSDESAQIYSTDFEVNAIKFLGAEVLFERNLDKYL